MQQSIYLVIPSIRDLHFLSEWGSAFQDCHLIIVEDRDHKTIKLPHRFFQSVTHLCWNDIRTDFGDDEWIFSRHNAGIRSYGFWKAWQAGADVVITIDDDCYPIGDVNEFVPHHLKNLTLKTPNKWFATYPDPKWMFTRGFPYDVRESYPVMISHGLWAGALDLDGKTESRLPQLLTEHPYPPFREFIPFGYYYPMCSMNLAFSREVIPLMFFPMMGYDPKGNEWRYDRYDDIWAGIISKKIMDHLQWGIVNGCPQVEHRKASLPAHNRDKEQNGLIVNEKFWTMIDTVKLKEKNPLQCYAEVIEALTFPDSDYFAKLQVAMRVWINLFV